MRAKDILPLNEVSMRPARLEQEAANLEARIGIEYEMIFGASDNDPEERQEDLSNNPAATSIERVVEFFYDGEHNSRRDVRLLSETLTEEFEEWLYGHIQKEWNEVEEAQVHNYIANNDFDIDETMEQYMEEELDLNEQQIRVALRAGKIAQDLDDRQLELFTDRNAAYRAWKEAKAHADQVLQDLVDGSIRSQDRSYTLARDEWEDQYREDNSDRDLQEQWFESQGINTMHEVSLSYDISWPYWDEPSNEASLSDVSRALGEIVGPISTRAQHTVGSSSRSWIVEPDSSIDADNGGTPVEIVSPAMSLQDTIKHLYTIKRWAARHECYTNESTGLHINISLPNYSLDRLDYVKLALFLGDRYILENFERVGNTYCKSSLGSVRARAREMPDSEIKQLFIKLHSGLEEIASRALYRGNSDKYSSINARPNWIEFRGPGGDWLSDSNYKQIVPTIHRMIVALDAALDPQKYRQEYTKKLYALFGDSIGEDLLAKFQRIQTLYTNTDNKYTTPTQDQLKAELLGRKLGGGEHSTDSSGNKLWVWQVSVEQTGDQVRVWAPNKAVAIQRAYDSRDDWSPGEIRSGDLRVQRLGPVTSRSPGR